MLHEEIKFCYGLPFLVLIHYIWTNTANNNMIGLSLHFISKDFVLMNVAALLVKKTSSMEPSTTLLRSKANFLQQYCCDIVESNGCLAVKPNNVKLSYAEMVKFTTAVEMQDRIIGNSGDPTTDLIQVDIKKK